MTTPTHIQAQTQNQTTGVSLLAIIALYTATMAVYADMYITQPILPVLSAEFGVAPATAGLSVSAVVLMIALASLASGPLSDMLGRKPVMVWSCGLLALPTLLCALAPNFTLLLFFRALQGICIPGLTAVAVAYMGDYFPSARLGALVGGWIGATVAGGLTGRVLSGLLTDHFGWRIAFVCFASITLACALLMAVTLPRDHSRATTGWRVAYRGMFAHLRDRRLVGVFLIGGTLFFGFLGTFTYLPYYLSQAPFALNPSAIALVYLVYLAGVIVSPIVGRLSTRISRRKLMIIGPLVGMVGMLGTLVPNLSIIIISLLILCTGMFIAQGVAPAYANATASNAKGGAGALYLMSYYVGGSLGAVLPGVAWQAFGWLGVTATALVALVAAWLAAWLLCAEEEQAVG
ncbi:MFS transporter [Candidatus Viridilinea mediisalina]|uniref:MFS transporter n=1 Tax=Candidatus Viridilinea mediisalina TaxID=2024553 RepID=A0A2A6RN42_9CHLR|nr:MFS transporter [Candidatus Viridilinea mediisalina]PDW04321.1 MFS transporter [Candidatus Viridilinea mediisalina]